ncbi:6939_t:CDS:2 [Gigaspora rosea]|nr:6939_t:CDS:2 [Gigaspora rosea]
MSEPQADSRRTSDVDRQIDLIDLSFDTDGDYKAIEVAAYLFDLFHSLGSPSAILQSDNGKLGNWKEYTGERSDCEPHNNCTLISELFSKNILDEESIPDTIEMQDVADDASLDNDFKGNTTTTPLADITGHEILRQSTCQNLEEYVEKMANQMSKGRKRVLDYVAKTENDQYQLGPKFGVIDVYYCANELEPLAKTENDQYQLGPKFGVIDVYYCANET